MVAVEHGHHHLLHVTGLGAVEVGDVEEYEYYLLAVRRHLAHHAGLVSRAAIMGHEQAFTDVEYSDHIFANLNLIHERGAVGGYTKHRLHELALHTHSLARNPPEFSICQRTFARPIEQHRQWLAIAGKRTTQYEGIS